MEWEKIMDGERFDALARKLATGGTSRRRFLRGLGGGLGGAVLAGLGMGVQSSEARGSCAGIGDVCTGIGQCCLGLVCAPNGTCQDARGLVKSLKLPGVGGLLGSGCRTPPCCMGTGSGCFADYDCCSGTCNHEPGYGGTYA